jgi:hypothetical protein
MRRAVNYSSWARSFVQTHRIVAVEMDREQAEYIAVSEGGSSYFLERLEQAQALSELLGYRGHSVVGSHPG